MVEVVALVLALVLVPITGGSFKRLARLDFEAPWLLFVGLGIQLVLELPPIVPASRADDVGFALLLASYVAILSFGILNIRITGMAVVTIGIALNVLVIALNQGMPYRAPEGTTLETTVKHRPERHSDILTVLDDRIIVPGPLGESVSCPTHDAHARAARARPRHPADARDRAVRERPSGHAHRSRHRTGPRADDERLPFLTRRSTRRVQPVGIRTRRVRRVAVPGRAPTRRGRAGRRRTRVPSTALRRRRRRCGTRHHRSTRRTRSRRAAPDR